jgi:hypothetical protein
MGINEKERRETQRGEEGRCSKLNKEVVVDQEDKKYAKGLDKEFR